MTKSLLIELLKSFLSIEVDNKITTDKKTLTIFFNNSTCAKVLILNK